MNKKISELISEQFKVIGDYLFKCYEIEMIQFKPLKDHAEFKDFDKWFYSQKKPRETILFYSIKDWTFGVMLQYMDKILIGAIPDMGYITSEMNNFFNEHQIKDYFEWNIVYNREYYGYIFDRLKYLAEQNTEIEYREKQNEI